MAELKKCPFCGSGEIKIIPEQIDARTVAYNFVCDECCCSTYFDYADREESIEAWNNRATEAEIRASVIDEALKALSIFNDREHGNEHFIYGIETAKEILEQLKEE